MSPTGASTVANRGDRLGILLWGERTVHRRTKGASVLEREVERQHTAGSREGRLSDMKTM